MNRWVVVTHVNGVKKSILINVTDVLEVKEKEVTDEEESEGTFTETELGICNF